MPYIKSISVRNTVNSCLKYIANPDKTAERLYISGLNCSEDILIAEKEFCLTYEHYSHKNFYEKLNRSGKSSIKAFHLIQSFKAEECNAEQAHKIGIEWIKNAFGEDYQALLCTHTDRDHIHNHICLCPYNLNGNKFNSNKKSLAHIRSISDMICRKYGIGEMEKLTSDEKHISSAVTYGEWKHKKCGTSWKDILRRKIDLIIPSADSFETLIEKLKQQGCTVKYGKYISVKLPEQQRAVRLKTLGAEYSEESISRRIKKSRLKTVSDIISEVMKEFTYASRKISYAKSVNSMTSVLANQLRIINDERLQSISDVECKLSEIEKTADITQSQINDLADKKKVAEEIISAAERYFKKYNLFEKSKQYPKAIQKKDKELLEKYNINSSDYVDEINKSIHSYSEKISDLQNSLDNIKRKTVYYRSIINTYKHSQNSDYISQLVKAAQDRMDKYEKAKFISLKAETFEIYIPNTAGYGAYDKLTKMPDIDDYFKSGQGSLFDIEGNSIAEQLENIYLTSGNIGVGAVIVTNKSDGKNAYYVDTRGFKRIPDFFQPRTQQKEKEEHKPNTVTKNRSI